MKRNSFLLLISSFIIAIVLSGCNNTTSVVSGDLVVNVDGYLRTSVNTNEKLKHPLTFGPAPSEYLLVDGRVVADFKQQSVTEKPIDDKVGTGVQYVFTGLYEGYGLFIEKQLTIKVYNGFPNLALFDVQYINKGATAVSVEKWVNNHYRILQNNDTLFWSFQGQSTEARADWILPVKEGFYQRNYMGMNNSDYGGGIPVSDVWRKDIGFAVGHVSLQPELVSIPVKMENAKYAESWVEKSFDEDKYELKNGETLDLP